MPYTGHIRKRTLKDGSSSYQIIIEGAPDPLTGKRERHYSKSRGTKKQAEIELHRLIAQYENGQIVTLSAAKLSTWLDEWLRLYSGNLAETTLVGYREKIRTCIVPYLGDIALNRLDAITVQEWINRLTANGASPKTVRNAYNILNPALDRAVQLRMIERNPCFKAELPKLQKPKIEVYDEAEVKEVLEAARDSDIYLMVLLLLAVGMRRGELAALRWDNVDLENKQLKICENRVNGDGSIITKTPKTASGIRTVSIGDDVVAELRKARVKYLEDKLRFGAGFHDLGYIIRKADGTPYSPDSLTQKWERFTASHGLKHIKLHALRHTNATMMAKANVGVRVMQERLGHADVSTTLNIYTHVLKSQDVEAAQQLDHILFSDAV